MKATPNATMTFSIRLDLTEGEARALDAIAGYGWDSFIKVFKEHLGQHYIRDHERDAESMFKKIRSEIPGALSHIDRTKKVWTGQNDSVDKRDLQHLQERAALESSDG